MEGLCEEVDLFNFNKILGGITVTEGLEITLKDVIYQHTWDNDESLVGHGISYGNWGQ